MKALLIGLFTFGLVGLVPSTPFAKGKDKSPLKKVKFKHKIPKTTKNLNFLSYKSVSKLEFANRVKYIKEFRKAILEVDKLQKTFGYKHAGIFPKNDNEMFASLISKTAWAKGKASDEHGRGAYISDQCISSAGISQYKKPGAGYQAFGCQPVECETASSTGVSQLKCGFMVTGLSGDNSCVPKYNKSKKGLRRFSPTEDCWEKSEQLTTQNKPQNDAEHRAISEKVNSLSGKSEAEIKAWLKSAEAKKILEYLKNNSYDPRMMAHLMGMSRLYAAYKEALPVPLEESEWNELAQGADKILGSFNNHCNKVLDAKALSHITNDKYVESWGLGWVGQKERARMKAAKGVLASTGFKSGKIKPTVANVLQIPECKVVSQRKEQISTAVAELNTTYPTQPIKEGDSPPKLPEKPQKYVQHMGCNFVGSESHRLPQLGTRCATCPAERAYINHTGDASYQVSRKWMSLLNTMALVCGDGCLGDRSNNVDAETAMEYVESFGHCGDLDYSWDTTPLGAVDENKVKNWGSRDYWNRFKDTSLFSNNRKQLNKDFHRIYGATLEDLVDVFCNKKDFTFWTDNRVHCDKRKPEERTKRYQRRRKHFSSFVKSGTGSNFFRALGFDKAPSEDLYSCIKDSKATADEIYTGPNGQCMEFVDYNSAKARNASAEMVQQAKGVHDKHPGPGGNIALIGNICKVPKQIDYDRGKQTRVFWTDPSQSSTNLDTYGGGGSRPINYYELNSEDRSKETHFFAYENPAPGDKIKITERDPTYKIRFSYVSSRGCPQPPPKKTYKRRGSKGFR